jgi:hypothetical protein
MTHEPVHPRRQGNAVGVTDWISRLASEAYEKHLQTAWSG